MLLVQPNTNRLLNPPRCAFTGSLWWSQCDHQLLMLGHRCQFRYAIVVVQDRSNSYLFAWLWEPVSKRPISRVLMSLSRNVIPWQAMQPARCACLTNDQHENGAVDQANGIDSGDLTLSIWPSRLTQAARDYINRKHRVGAPKRSIESSGPMYKFQVPGYYLPDSI